MKDVLADLAQRIREIEGRPSGVRQRVAQGSDAFAGLPCPGLVEVHGAVGSGRMRLVLSWLVACRRQVAWVDPEKLFYAPTAAAHGVRLEQLLLVRPSEALAGWAVEQLLLSGCFELVVLAALPDLRGIERRWERAARHGHSTLVLLTTHSHRRLPADLRLGVQHDEVVVHRCRQGTAGSRFGVPVWAEGHDPWV